VSKLSQIVQIVATYCMLAVSAAPAVGAAISPAAAPVLQTAIEAVLAEEQLSGVAWSLVRPDSEARLGAAGFSDNAIHKPFTTDTQFHVGSVTKSLLSVGVLRLVTMGHIDIDAPVSTYLADDEFDNPWRATIEVTVRHLLDHTSGLEDARLWHIFSQRAGPNTPLREAFVDRDLLRIRTKPGAVFSYSNMGYTLLGLIIESVTGEGYEAWLDENLLDAMGMHNSTFRFTTQQASSGQSLLAWGHVDDGSRYAAQPGFLRPAGQFTTTADDLARLAQFLLDDGWLAGQPFIDTNLMQARGWVDGTDAALQGLVAGYALGMGRRDRHGVVGFCHGGNVVGFVAMLCIFPNEGKAFSYSVNTDSETADYGRIDKLLIAALDVAPAQRAETVSPASDITDWLGWYVLSPNRFQTFEYLDTVFGAVMISGPTNALNMAYLQQPDRQLRSLGGRHYSANDRATASHVFFRGANGDYSMSDGFKTYLKVPAVYLMLHGLSIALGLLGLVWLLIAGLVSLLRHRVGARSRVEAPAFIAVLLLVTPVPFFLTQSFMALGDFTPASALLALTSMLLPVGMLLTLMRAVVSYRQPLALLHGFAAAFVLQWSVVLMTAGLLPLRLWL
jgi:CubicO group peptidase (beta-lactamase class C family)